MNDGMNGDDANTGETSRHGAENSIVGMSFFLLGLLNNLSFVVTLSSAEDIAPHHAGAVLSAAILPGILAKLTFNLWALNTSYFARIIILSISESASMFVLSILSKPSTSIAFKLACICVISFAGSTGESSYLGLATRFLDQNKQAVAVSLWSSGTGMSGLAGAGVYVLFTQSFRLSANTTLRIVSPFLLLQIALYTSIQSHLVTESSTNPTLVSTYDLDNEHADLSEKSNDDLSRTERTQSLEFALETNLHSTQESDGNETLEDERRKILRDSLLGWTFCLSIVYFMEYLLNQGVLPTIDNFGDTESMSPKSDTSKYYARYQLLYQLGVFISRSSISLLRVRKLWTLAVFQTLNVVILLIQATTDLVKHPWIVYGIVMWEGLLGGCAYVNVFWRIAHEIPSKHAEWSMAIGTLGETGGASLAALVDSFLECFLRKYQNKTC